MDNCPNCKANWIGEEIPDHMKPHYAGTHWRNEIHIDGGYVGIYDGTVAIRCPDCHSEFPVNKSKWAKELFDRYIAERQRG